MIDWQGIMQLIECIVGFGSYVNDLGELKNRTESCDFNYCILV